MIEQGECGGDEIESLGVVKLEFFESGEDLKEYLGVEEVTQECIDVFYDIELKVLEVILPNKPKEKDRELFRKACALQYQYMQTEEYQTLGLKSFSIGNFSGSREDKLADNAVYLGVSPTVKSLLLINGYLYKGLRCYIF